MLVSTIRFLRLRSIILIISPIVHAFESNRRPVVSTPFLRSDDRLQLQGFFSKRVFLEDVIVAEEWSSENVWSSMERTTDRLIKGEGPWDAKKRIAENGYTLFISFIYN